MTDYTYGPWTVRTPADALAAQAARDERMRAEGRVRRQPQPRATFWQSAHGRSEPRGGRPNMTTPTVTARWRVRQFAMPFRPSNIGRQNQLSTLSGLGIWGGGNPPTVAAI